MYERPMMPKTASLPDSINARRDLALSWQDAGFRVLPELEKHAGTVPNPHAGIYLAERATWCRGTKEAAAYEDLARCHDTLTPDSLMQATWQLDRAIGITDAHYQRGIIDPIEIAWAYPAIDPAAKRAEDTAGRIAGWVNGGGFRKVASAFGEGVAYKLASEPGQALVELADPSIRLLSGWVGLPVAEMTELRDREVRSADEKQASLPRLSPGLMGDPQQAAVATPAQPVQALMKVAYGPKEHRGLAGVMAHGMQAGAPMRDIVQAGALEADAGIRHPWLPHTDAGHSFAGSQTRAMVGQNVRAPFMAAREDVARAIAGRHTGGLYDRAVSGIRAVRGMKTLGEAQHRLADISAHYDKPLAAGANGGTDVRRAFEAHPGMQVGYGGGIVGAAEHHAGGLYRGDDGGVASHLDDLRPSKNVHDAQAVSRSRSMGTAFRRQIEGDLVRAHGMTPQQATAAAQEFFTTANPGVVSRTLGEASRDARYVRDEIGRLGGAIRNLGGALVRRIR